MANINIANTSANVSGDTILTAENTGQEVSGEINFQDLRLRDTDDSHLLRIVAGSNLTANRIFTLHTDDAARAFTVDGDAAINQDVRTSASPTFVDITLGNGSVSTPAVKGADADSGVMFDQTAGVSSVAAVINGVNILNISDGPSISTNDRALVEIRAYAGDTAGLASRGPKIAIGRNTAGSGAPGLLLLTDLSGAQWALWVSTTGKLYIAAYSVAPQADGNPSDTSGTVVGSQS